MLKKVLSIFKRKEEKNSISFSCVNGRISVDIALKSYETEDLDQMVHLLSIFLTEYGMSDTLTIMRTEFLKDNREYEFKYIAQELSILSQKLSEAIPEESSTQKGNTSPCISPSEMI